VALYHRLNRLFKTC